MGRCTAVSLSRTQTLHNSLPPLHLSLTRELQPSTLMEPTSSMAMGSFATPPPVLSGAQVTINCMGLGKTSKADVFPVIVGLDNSVMSLKKLIVRAESSLKNVDPSSLTLWRVKIKGHDQAWDAPTLFSSSEFLKSIAIEMTAPTIARCFGAQAQALQPHLIHVLAIYRIPPSNTTNSSSQAPTSLTFPSTAVAPTAPISTSPNVSSQTSHSTLPIPKLGSPLLLGDRISINCLCLGRTSPKNVFSVRIGVQNTFADLQKLIVIAESSWLKYTDPKSLTLWSVHMTKQAEVWRANTWRSDLAFLQSLGNPIDPDISLSKFRSKHPRNIHVIVDWWTVPEKPSLARRSTVVNLDQISMDEAAKATSSIFGEDESQAPEDAAITISLSEDASDDSEPSSPSALSSSIVLVPSDSESVAMSDSSDEAAIAALSSAAGAATTSDCAPSNISSQASHSTSSNTHPSESAGTLASSCEATISTSSSTTAAAATVSDCASRDVSPLNSHPSASTSHTFEPARMPASSGEAASTVFSSAAAPCCAPPDVSSQVSHPSTSSYNSSESEGASTVTAVPLSTATADSGIAASVKQLPPIPLALLHRAFGTFIDDLAGPQCSDRKFESDFTSKLSDMLSITTTAEQRLLGFTHLLREQLGINLKSGGEAGTMTASVNGHAYVMLQSPGDSAFSSDGDPFALCYNAYEEYVGRLSDDPSKLPVLPCLHIIICGPFMSFAGSAMACGSQRFEILLPAILFHPNLLYYGDAMKNQASRAFKALANSAEALKRFYSDPSSRILNAPYPNIYRTQRGNFLVTLTIEKRLELDSDDLVYRGLEDEATPIVVGFTCRPREGNEGFFSMSDPGLRYAEQLPGGWYMTVRDPWARLIEAGF